MPCVCVCVRHAVCAMLCTKDEVFLCVSCEVFMSIEYAFWDLKTTAAYDVLILIEEVCQGTT